MGGCSPSARAVIRGLLFAAALLLAPAAAQAQHLIYALPGGVSADNISTPNGFAAPAGIFYAGVSAHSEPRAGDALDALAIIGAGTGSISSAIELSLVVSDVSALSGEFITAKWHFHDETARSPAVAVGIEDITASASHSATPYVAATKTFWDTSARSAFLMRKTVSLGFGGGRFHRRLFGAASVSLDSFSKAIAEYDGQGVNVGVSVSEHLTPRAVAVLVLAYQDLVRPDQHALTMSLAVAWHR